MNLGRKRWISLVFCIKYFLVWGIGKWRVHSSSSSSQKIYSSFIVGGQLWLEADLANNHFLKSSLLNLPPKTWTIAHLKVRVLQPVGFWPVIEFCILEQHHIFITWELEYVCTGCLQKTCFCAQKYPFVTNNCHVGPKAAPANRKALIYMLVSHGHCSSG